MQAIIDKHCPCIVRIASLLVILLASAVMYGWFSENTQLIQLHSTFAPMQFNTALGFLLLGGGLMALSFRFYLLTFIMAMAGSLLGGLTLAQYLFHLDLGIDQLFVQDYVQTRVTQPGRMSPLTALCLLLLGKALIHQKRHTALRIGLAFGAFVISLFSLLSYLFDNQSLYGAGIFSRMALHTAGSFFILSAGFLVLEYFRKGREEIDKWHLTPVLTLTLCLIMTFLTWFSVSESTKALNQEYFETLVSDVKGALHERYEIYEQSLYGGLGLFYASDTVELDEWSAYVNAINIEKNLPGINGLGYIHYVTKDNLADYLAYAKENISPDFDNHPATDFNDKLIIQYIEPRRNNKEAVGLDIGFEANRREAAERARDTGNPALTEKIELVQDQKKQAGFLLLIPSYDTGNVPNTVRTRREHFLGWVYAPFIGPNFFDGLTAINRDQIEFDVYDGDIIKEDALIFSTHEHPAHMHGKGLPENVHNYQARNPIQVGGRTWTIFWSSNDNFLPPGDRNLAHIIAIGGIIFSLLLYFILSRIIYSRQIIDSKVKHQTKKLAEASAFQKLITNSIPDLIFVKDREFRIVQANEAFLALYPEEMRSHVIGATTIENYSPEEAELFLENDRTAFAEGYSETEETIIFPDGKPRTLFTKKVAFENADGKRFILGIARDITKRKEAQQQIIKANEELQRSNDELERFAYLASHDLQEPLRKISGFTKRLHKSFEGQLDDKTQTYMDFIIDGADRMRDLIKGLLAYSRIQTDRIATEKLDAGKIVEEAKSNLETLIKEQNAQIRCRDLPFIYHDKVMLTQLFQNLISNAIKYKSDKKPVITISASLSAEQGGDEWIFAVKDNGMGMEEKFLGKIFEMFQRLHRREEIAGTGIGLSLCQKIVERYGGRIWVESAPGKGSTFFFTVPAAEDNHDEQ